MHTTRLHTCGHLPQHTFNTHMPDAACSSDTHCGVVSVVLIRLRFLWGGVRLLAGAPHWVDFGQELQYSPDGKAYLVGHGSSNSKNIQAWMLGDQVYMARQ